MKPDNMVARNQPKLSPPSPALPPAVSPQDVRGEARASTAPAAI